MNTFIRLPQRFAELCPISLFLLVTLTSLLTLQGCGSSSSSSSDPGVTISISPATASVAITTTKQFTAVISGTGNTAVTWQANGVTGGDATHGTISTSGLYTAPASVPSPASVTIRATSQADSTKSATATVMVTSGDATPPTAPANLVATASSTTQIGLAWTASTDNVAVTSYDLERCSGAGCTAFAQIGTSTVASFSDSGLTASTSYSYRVRATDAAGNLSGYSNISSAITSAMGSSNIIVSVSPRRGGLTVTQQLSTLKATLVNDTTNAGVSWSSSGGGTFSPTTSLSGVPVTFTAPSSAGVVTITATSVADGSKTATATIGVTDLAAVSTYLNGNSRQGGNLQEHALTTSGPTTVNSTNFGKLFSCTVDGAIYAQPLWVANLTIAGAKHNVVFVATQHDTVYAFDADANPCVPLWSASLLATGETWVSASDVGGCGDLEPEIGIVGTPVIDPTSNSMFVVSKTKNSNTFHQRVHALDITTGSDKVSPTEISATVAGTGIGSTGGMVSFDPMWNNQRPALLLVNGHVIISWASHCDFGPYHGWVMSYSTSLQQEAVFNTSPNGINTGVWMSGNGPSADSGGNIYFAVGNGTFDVTNTTGPTNDYGDSIIKLGPPSGGGFSSLSYFRSFRQQPSPDNADQDQGSGGVLLLPAVGAKNYAVQAGKDGIMYVLNQASLGGFSNATNNVIQEILGQLSGGVRNSPSYWNGRVFFSPSGGGGMHAFAFDSVTSGTLSTTPTSTTSNDFGFPGPTTSISANGSLDGIAWALNNQNYCTQESGGCGSAVLFAFDATNLANQLWNSGSTAGNAVKFTVPTVANGKVYVGTRGNNTGGVASSTTVPGELDVYGLLP